MTLAVAGAGRTALRAIGSQGQSDSPLLYLHAAIALAGNRWLGDETFRLLSFEGEESISEPFGYQLELRGNTSPGAQPPLDFTAVIGRPVTVGINRPDGGGEPDAAARFASALKQGRAADMVLRNGVVASFSMAEPGVYRLDMKPSLWKLTLTNRYAVYPHMTIRGVIAQLMRTHYIDYSLEGVSGDDDIALARTQDWLQAGESDYEFLRRLMGKAHIYYYFRHTGNGHTVVFANRPAYPPACGDRPLRYTHTAIDQLGLSQDDIVFEYGFRLSLTATGVNGGFAHEQSASQVDAIPTFQAFSAFTPADPGELPFNQYRTYQYGLSEDEVRHYVKNTASSLAASAQQLTGGSTCSAFAAGHGFSLRGEMAAGCYPAPVRPSLEGRRFVLSRVQHKASADGGYTNTFEATDAGALLTAFSVQDTQQGTLLAQVVDTQGRRPNDWRFYDPTNFDPQSSRLRDTRATPQDLMARGVYVRFSTPGADAGPVWVKLAAHMTTVPEIGVMVMVSRANDESELPEVQSIVQANGSLVVTPSGWTANTHVGSSYSTSYGDGQSIRFGRGSAYDLDRAVGIVNDHYAGGEYRDTSYSQGASYSYSTSENGAAGLLSRSESLGCTYSTFEGLHTSSTSTVGDSYSDDTVTGTATRVSSQATATSTSSTGMQSSANTTGLTCAVDTTGMSSVISAVALSIGASTTGMATQTALTGLRNDTSLTGASTSLSVTGISDNTQATGTSRNTSVTGVSEQTSVTGSSVSVSLTGTTQQTSITGATSDIGIVGTATRMSVTGESTGINVTGSSTDVSVSGSESRVGVHGTSTSIDLTGDGLSLSIGSRLSIDIGSENISLPLIYLFV
jgi:type VI secretion system secreted protein VgrG